MQQYQVEQNELMQKLKSPLFKKSPDFRVERELLNNSTYYAVTFNPHPLTHFNRKQYRAYNHDQQRNMLLRIEAAFRKLNPSIELVELNFEICPTLKQIHYHAMYKLPAYCRHEFRSYFLKYQNAKFPDYLHLRVDPINNKAGWLQYIRKDIQ